MNHSGYHCLRACLMLVTMACAMERSVAQSTSATRTAVIADFKPTLISKIAVGKGVTIKRIDDNAVELRIAPFKDHGNQWPLIAFGPNYFGETINLADFSRIELKIHHQSEGMLSGHLDISTSPDATRMVDSENLLIPANNSMKTSLGVKSLKYNDPSEISVIQVVFSPRETETVIRMEAIRGVYDPVVGSAADALIDSLAQAKKTLARMNSSGSVGELKGRIADFKGELDRLRPSRFRKSLRALGQKMSDLQNEIARLKFSGSGPMWVWEADRYEVIAPRSGPGLEDESLKKISMSMAGNEFRDFVFSVAAPESDLALTVALRAVGTPALPSDAFEVRVVEYRKNRMGDMVGDALLPVDGPVPIPRGESRQFWVRFDTRTSRIDPGTYDFECVLSDDARHVRNVVPGAVEVWNFSLPTSDVLPNNSYAEFASSQYLRGESLANAVREMKLYGLNQIFVHPVQMPRPLGLDDELLITGYDDEVFRSHINEAIAAWMTAPGDGTLHFIFSISGFEELGLKRDGYAFPNGCWKNVFAQWLTHLKAIVSEAGLTDDQWMMVLRDESGEPALKQIEIPLAEAIKSLDPSIRITCNSSCQLVDASWAGRFFAAFDVFQPHLSLQGDETLNWLRGSGKELWVYQCQADLNSIGRDIYGYYRVYGWDLLDKGFVGTGLWTYCAQAPSTWDVSGDGCVLIHKHPDRGLVHSTRYELFREGIDDFRYVKALRDAAEERGGKYLAEADEFIAEAVRDVTTHRGDRTRCEAWRLKIAEALLAMK